VVIDSFFPKKAVPTAPVPASGANIVAERHWFMGTSLCEKTLSDGALCGRVQLDPIHFGN
jgi:hypothetical protein